MRNVRIAALVVTAALLCLLVARVLTVDPPRPDNSAILDSHSDGPNNVPAPPPAPGIKAVQPVKKRPAPERVAEVAPEPEAVQPEASEAKPTIWQDGEPLQPAAKPAGTDGVEIASAEEHTGPVIVVPHERPKQDSRGVRWIKAVGHVLGIGEKDPAEQAFR